MNKDECLCMFGVHFGWVGMATITSVSGFLDLHFKGLLSLDWDNPSGTPAISEYWDRTEFVEHERRDLRSYELFSALVRNLVFSRAHGRPRWYPWKYAGCWVSELHTFSHSFGPSSFQISSPPKGTSMPCQQKLLGWGEKIWNQHRKDTYNFWSLASVWLPLDCAQSIRCHIFADRCIASLSVFSTFMYMSRLIRILLH